MPSPRPPAPPEHARVARSRSPRRRRRLDLAQAAVIEALEARRLLAQSIWAYPGADGKLLYKPLPLGDKIEDYSNVGYMGGAAAIPNVPVKITVSPVDGDDTSSIQGAINFVQGLAADAAGFRGAVLLAPGTYEIATTLRITASGVVLRGSGQGQTTLLATGTEKDTTIQLDGNAARTVGTRYQITDKYVPVGAISLSVSSADVANFVVGDTVMIQRTATTQWLHDIGADQVVEPWTGRNVDMDRTITRIDGNVITLDAPLTHALDRVRPYGGGTIGKYTAAGRISNVGVENITGESTFDPTLLSGSDRVDENHAEHFIGVDGVINGWVRNVTSKYFGYSCVNMTGPSKWVTVQDAQCLDPVSLVTGGRRYSFNMGDSTNVLWRNLYTRDGRHDYVQGSEVTGPNVVVDSRADKARADTGPHHRYSTGTLWDNLDVNGNAINIQNRWNSGSGHGWAGANQVVWNSEANSFTIQNIGWPNTAWNWAIGNIGTQNTGDFIAPDGTQVGSQGLYDSHGTKVDTRSLFHAQMAEKLAHENWMLREVRIGDADGYIAGDAADNATLADAAWRTAVQAATGRTSSNTDAVANNQLVPLTFNFPLDPGTYVVGASLSLGFKSAGNNTSGDTIYVESANRAYTWAQLGVVAPGLAGDAVVIDLSKLLAALQDGKLNIAVSGNTAIDWATLNLQTASTTQPQMTTLTPTDDAYVDQATPTTNFGGATSVYTKLNGAADNRESFLKFDLTSLSGNVTNAYVRMVPTSVGYNATTFGTGVGAMFNRVSFVGNDAWTEGAINWNNKPTSDPFFREFLSYVNEPLTFDVTALVRAAQAGDKQLSLRLNSMVDDDNSQITFASSENANVSLRPQLVIQTFDSLNPIADATVRGGANGNTNFGTAADLAVKRDTSATSDNNREAFLKFDLSGVTAAPAGATVRLMPVTIGAPTAPGSADLVNVDTWTETGITWNTKPSASTVLGTSNVWPATPLKFNATSQVIANMNGDDLFSVRFYSNTVSAGVNQYAAREWADGSLRPMLVLKNLGPQITGVLNVAGNLNTTTAPQWFGVWDSETAAGSLAVSATSSNPTLLPNANITFGGSGMDRTFTLTPAAGQSGSSTVTITVTDAQGQTTNSVFQFNVVNSVALNGDQSAPNQNDVFKVVRNGSFLDIFRNDMVTPIVHVDYASSPRYTIQALGGADQVLIDLSGGNPIPAVGLAIDGGTGSDMVSVIGSSGADAVTLQDGDIMFGSTIADIAAGSTEELHLNLGAGADTLAAGGNASVSAGVVKLNVAGGGSVSMGAASTLPDFTDLTVNAGATFNLNGVSQTIDGLAGAGIVTNNGGASATLTVGSAGSSSSFAGNLTGATLGLTKVGAGTLTLSGTNDYDALTTIAGGAIAAGTAAAFGGLNAQVRFMGGTFRAAGNIVIPNFSNKFTTSFSGATAAHTGTFEVDAGMTLTMGGANASLQTNGAGGHGGRFTKTGAGTLRILGNNGQLDDPFSLNQGTVIIESATALGGADNSNNRVEMKAGTTLYLREDTPTNFLTPISVIDAGGVVHLFSDRKTFGAGVTHSVNALTSAGQFQINVARGLAVTSGTGGISIGSVTLGGNGALNVGANAAVTVSGAITGAFGLSKSGAGTLGLSGTNSYTGATNVSGGAMVINGNLTTSSAVIVTAGVLRLAPNKMHVIRTQALSITGSGQVDLTDNKLILAGGAANIGSDNPDGTYTGVTRLIQTGRGIAGTWDGAGLITSEAAAVEGLTTLAIATADDTNYAGSTFGGVAVASGDLLVMYTHTGDADLSGYIDAVDYGYIDNWIQFPGTSGYFNGDFNYDGIIDAADYGYIDNNIQMQGAAFPV